MMMSFFPTVHGRQLHTHTHPTPALGQMFHLTFIIDCFYLKSNFKAILNFAKVSKMKLLFFSECSSSLPCPSQLPVSVRKMIW